MIRVICPKCHSRCRLRKDLLSSNINRGKCPKCGHFFSLPKLGNRTNDKELSQKPGKKYVPDSFRTRTLLICSGVILLLFCVIIFSSAKHTTTHTPQKKYKDNPAKKIHAAATSKPSAKKAVSPKPVSETLQLDLQAKNRAILSIKHHALVADAEITSRDQEIQLALLVSDKTPITYASSLGRQFAHYVKELIPADQPKPTFKVSVYYPDGTRVVVTTSNETKDEEVIHSLE